MNALTRISLANRALVALVTIAVLIFGAVAAVSLKQELLPPFSVPTASITTAYPGAAPQIVERDVTEKVEGAVDGGEGQKRITSFSSDGMSGVSVEYEHGTDLDKVLADLRQRIARIQPLLPARVTPEVAPGVSTEFPVMSLAVAGDDERALARRLQELAPAELGGIDGVSRVLVSGERARRVEVRLDLKRLGERGLTADAVAAALTAGGSVVPAGTLTDGGRSLALQVGEGFDSLGDLRRLHLAPKVTLDDVADVALVEDRPQSLTRTDGRPSLGVSVIAGPGGNTVAIAAEVGRRIPGLTRALGSGTTLTVTFDQSEFIEKSIGDLTTEGLLGLGFAALVILVFLFSFRSTLVTVISIPLSLVVALIGLWANGFTLNMLTLGALTIAIGRVVDDSIVVIENVKRHLGYGEAKREAVLTGTREVAGAVTASTLTTVAVFLPIAFTGGISGALFSAFALTVTIALLASLLVSLTVIPVLAYWFLKAPAAGVSREAVEAGERRGLLQRAYVPVIRFAVRRRWVTLLAAAAIFVVTGGLAGQLKTDFLGSSGQTTLQVRQELPEGTSLEAADAAARTVERAVGDVPGVASYQVTVEPDRSEAGGARNVAAFTLTAEKDADMEALRRDVRARVSELAAADPAVGEVTVQGDQGGLASTDLAVTVTAADDASLARAADLVAGAVRRTPGAAEVEAGISGTSEQLSVRVDDEKALARGLSVGQVTQAVARVTQGEQVARITLDGAEHDVSLRVGRTAGDVAALRDLRIPAPLGRTVALEDVAVIETVSAPARLSRIDGERATTVSAKFTGDDLGAASAALDRRLDALELPGGAAAVLGGVSLQQSESFGSLFTALAAAILIVYLVMVATFRSLAHPLMLLVSIPFAATGALGLLVATGTPLGLPSLIGMLMLVGIVVTNAIVLLDLVRQYRESGMSAREAVVEGGRHRVRPVIMTAVATICALTPMALGLTGDGGFLSRPLAVVVIGGLTSSTLLTLVLLPTLYTIVEDVKDRFRRPRRALRVPEPEREPVHTG
ncbi:efflux RND transporter permease subunit [Planomonospora venezuelensis]|uniref:HAE1 family hydrophobic/amphiphilic exporter-1 n=1 Tax=Planomonospora venezuelensis TaxID=1999 RepID=A0A841DIE3_PLAVE|nr:efflux RND transporter permease subunit [Planomonospora venezuelensis]MBB5967855.1 HAE1 family hydrophobic/amphiphilic exporter-1 [Planomonospora venezuelensis]GIN03255.1 hydrogenase expression protein [Planomonospora venezuelensis]